MVLNLLVPGVHMCLHDILGYSTTVVTSALLRQSGRKRLRNDRSDDEYDGDYPGQSNSMEHEEESNTIMLRCLPPDVTEDDVSVTDIFEA